MSGRQTLTERGGCRGTPLGIPSTVVDPHCKVPVPYFSSTLPQASLGPSIASAQDGTMGELSAQTGRPHPQSSEERCRGCDTVVHQLPRARKEDGQKNDREREDSDSSWSVGC